MPPRLDVLVWGATGYSGRLIARYLAARGTPGLRWGVCGRDAGKVARLVAELPRAAGVPPPVELAGDAGSAAAVDAAVRSARVVLAAAGPFSAVGDAVVDACVAHGVHYVDINGETPWVRRVIDRCGAAAAAAGVSVVPNAGFDAVPFDLGAFYTAQAVRQATGRPAEAVRCYVAMTGGLSGGTLATGMHMEELGFGNVKKLANPYLLGGAPSTGARAEDRDVRVAAYSEEMAAWTGPFLMSVVNTRVVRRSMELLAGPVYAPDASYREVALAEDEAAARALLVKKPLAERKALVASGALPAAGEGPSDEENAAAGFTADFFGVPAGGGPAVHTRVAGAGAYVETARTSVEAALLLAGGHGRAGVLTPAAALGEKYVDALRTAGMSFEVLPTDSPSASGC